MYMVKFTLTDTSVTISKGPHLVAVDALASVHTLIHDQPGP